MNDPRPSPNAWTNDSGSAAGDALGDDVRPGTIRSKRLVGATGVSPTIFGFPFRFRLEWCSFGGPAAFRDLYFSERRVPPRTDAAPPITGHA